MGFIQIEVISPVEWDIEFFKSCKKLDYQLKFLLSTDPQIS